MVATEGAIQRGLVQDEVKVMGREREFAASRKVVEKERKLAESVYIFAVKLLPPAFHGIQSCRVLVNVDDQRESKVH